VDTGKSTLIGVLTSGTLDNGKGLARAQVTELCLVPLNIRYQYL